MLQIALSVAIVTLVAYTATRMVMGHSCYRRNPKNAGEDICRYEDPELVGESSAARCCCDKHSHQNGCNCLLYVNLIRTGQDNIGLP